MLTVVTGPPCAGKTTYVREHRASGDVVVDLDAIAAAFGYPDAQIQWGATHLAVDAARMARAHVIAALLSGRLQATAWVIDTDPPGSARAQYERAEATTVRLDPGRSVCLERAAARPQGTVAGIEAWYAKHGEKNLAQALDIFD